MILVVRFVLILAAAMPMWTQQGGLSTRNPLDEIKDELIRVLSDAKVPFTAEQERSIALVLEESRRASEELFGDVMDFRDGPPQGERLDRARAGIEWMNGEFSRRVRDSLTAEQRTVWDEHLKMKAASADSTGGPSAGTSEQVQEIRINNNPFTPENQFWGWAGSGGSFGFADNGGVSTEIIERGGTGAFHGSYQFRFRDESLNARNAFSDNKPPYQQRNFDINTSGPVLRNRLTAGFGANQSQQDNVGTINAETPDGPFQLGFTRPAVFRNFWSDGTYQIDNRQALLFGVNFGHNKREMQDIGEYNLPERAVTSSGGYRSLTIRHVWFLSERLVQDIAFDTGSDHGETIPVSTGVAIDVLGAFSRGGSQNRNENQGRSYGLRSLWISSGDRWTIRTGGSWNYSKSDEVSENNYLGTFEFPDLDAYLAGAPTFYRVTRGNPRLTISQQEMAAFVQAELKASKRLTVFFGLRHEAQTNLDDYNNFDPRLSAAYALGNSTVVRAGIGVFHRRVENWVIRELRRLDGAQQYEIVIQNPSYPDPFQSGSATVVPPASRRVLAEDFTAPYNINSAFVVEQSLPGNLFVSASLDHHRGIHTLRGRDLNAPLPGTPPDPDGTVPRPDPAQGPVLQLESSGLSNWTALRLNMRQRFSIFNVSANYNIQSEKDEGGGPFSTPTNNYDFGNDLARTTRHEFNLSVNSRLPFGVYLTGEVELESGDAYSVTTGRDDNGDGVSNDRPPGEPRNGRYEPREWDVSFNVSKSFSVGDSRNGRSPKSLNLFSSISNAFNMTNHSDPVSVVTSRNFGKFLSASEPREIEVGLRFQF